MDLPSITTAMAALNFARQAIAAALDTKIWSEAVGKITQAQDQLLKAQDGLFIYSAKLAELQEKLRITEGELAELKRMKLDRENYALVELTEKVFVYRSKPGLKALDGGTDAIEPEHHLCEKCFQDGTKSILQQSVGPGPINLKCFRCGASYYTGRDRPGPAFIAEIY